MTELPSKCLFATGRNFGFSVLPKDISTCKRARGRAANLVNGADQQENRVLFCTQLQRWQGGKIYMESSLLSIFFSLWFSVLEPIIYSGFHPSFPSDISQLIKDGTFWLAWISFYSKLQLNHCNLTPWPASEPLAQLGIKTGCREKYLVWGCS